MGCELLSGAQVVVLQHCPVKTNMTKVSSKQSTSTADNEIHSTGAAAATTFIIISGLTSLINDATNMIVERITRHSYCNFFLYLSVSLAKLFLVSLLDCSDAAALHDQLFKTIESTFSFQKNITLTAFYFCWIFCRLFRSLSCCH